jgi:hypothetical protein
MFPVRERPYKRDCQNRLTSLIPDDISGSLYVLAGTTPFAAIQQYIDRQYEKIVLVENDVATFNQFVLPWTPPSDISINKVNKDIFDIIEHDSNIGGIDLDLCTTLTPHIQRLIVSAKIVALINNNEKFWMRITSSMRPLNKINTRRYIDIVKASIILGTRFTLASDVYDHYRSGTTRGAPMHVWQGIFSRTQDNSPVISTAATLQLHMKEREEVEEMKRIKSMNTNGRTFMDLSDSEKKEIRKLACSSRSDDWFRKSVSKYGLAKMSVAALVAHRTMGTY